MGKLLKNPPPKMDPTESGISRKRRWSNSYYRTVTCGGTDGFWSSEMASPIAVVLESTPKSWVSQYSGFCSLSDSGSIIVAKSGYQINDTGEKQDTIGANCSYIMEKDEVFSLMPCWMKDRSSLLRNLVWHKRLIHVLQTTIHTIFWLSLSSLALGFVTSHFHLMSHEV